ncbi:MAG: hypothetical protein ACOX4M_02145 [Acetivibrionales bacterium]
MTVLHTVKNYEIDGENGKIDAQQGDTYGSHRLIPHARRSAS